MAERGLVSAPNMAVGESFNIEITAVQAGATAGVPGLGDLAGKRRHHHPRYAAGRGGVTRSGSAYGELKRIADGPSGLLRAFLATDVYTDKCRLRSEDRR
jgi:hypothetical protein